MMDQTFDPVSWNSVIQEPLVMSLLFLQRLQSWLSDQGQAQAKLRRTRHKSGSIRLLYTCHTLVLAFQLDLEKVRINGSFS